MINAKSPKCGRAPYGTTLLASLYLKFKKAQKKKKRTRKGKNSKRECVRHVTYSSRDRQRRRRIAPAAAYPAASAAAL